MALIRKNEQISKDTYIMEVEGDFKGKAGQFYMMKNDIEYPLLARPISIFEIDGNAIKFMYRVVGEGTEIFSKKRTGEEVILNGPYGNGFPSVKGKIALVGGGMGVAPLYQTAKELKDDKNIDAVNMFLGFSEEIVIKDAWDKVADKLTFDVGGIITEKINPEDFDMVFACGPEVMLDALYEKCKKTNTPIYISKESKMACGIGACLVCTCKTENGKKKICKDGPVFKGEEIYG